MLLIRVCQWIKLRIQLITKDPVEVIRAGFRKSDKPSSKIPGMFKGQLFIWSPTNNELSLEDAFNVWMKSQPTSIYEPVNRMTFGQIGWK